MMDIIPVLCLIAMLLLVTESVEASTTSTPSTTTVSSVTPKNASTQQSTSATISQSNTPPQIPTTTATTSTVPLVNKTGASIPSIVPFSSNLSISTTPAAHSSVIVSTTRGSSMSDKSTLTLGFKTSTVVTTWTHPIDLCLEPSTPDHGSITTNGTFENATAFLTCDAGYKGVENTAVCLSSGNWSRELTCTQTDCGIWERRPVYDSRVTYKNHTTFGSLAILICNDGYKVINSSKQSMSAVCQANGTWSIEFTPECEPIDCGKWERRPVYDSRVTYKNHTTFGSLAILICDDGYKVVNSSKQSMSTVCQANGTWSIEFTPKCEPIECTALAPPANGSIEFSNRFSVNSTAVITCVPGYTLEGESTIKCLENGTWSDITSTCTPNGYGLQFALSKSLTQGDFNGSITIKCSVDAAVLNISTIHVQDMTLSRQLDRAEWEILAVLDNDGNVTLSRDSRLFYKIQSYDSVYEDSTGVSVELTLNKSFIDCQDSTTYRCNMSYTDVNGHLNYAENTRHLDGLFRPEGVTITGLLNGDEISENSKMSPTQMKEGDLLEINCTAVVKDDSIYLIEWFLDSETLFYYTKYLDANPIDAEHCLFTVTDTFTIGGYILEYIGARKFTINCVVLPVFSPELSSASSLLYVESHLCPQPATPDHGSITINGTFKNATAFLTCDTGYEAAEKSAFCLSSGNWSRELICAQTDCGLWERLSDHNSRITYSGNYKNSTTFGSLAILNCDDGFKVVNSSRQSMSAVCQANGTWDIKFAPECEPVVCPPFLPLKDNYTKVFIRNASQLLVNTTATFSCTKKEYVISGSPFIKCQSNGQWTDAPPNCTKVPTNVNNCSSDQDSRGMQWNETRPGTNVISDCPQKYAGQISRMCTLKGKWLLPVYNCISKELQEVDKNIAAVLDNPAAAAETVAGALGQLKDLTEVKTDKEIYSGEIEKVTSVLERIANISDKINVTDNQAQNFLDTTSNLLDRSNTNAWKSIEDNQEEAKQEKGAVKVLTVISKYSDAIFNSLNSTQTSKTIPVSNLVLHVSKIPEHGDVVFPQLGEFNLTSSYKLPEAAINGLGNFSSVLYKNLSGILPSHSVSQKNTTTQIESSVVSIKIKNWESTRNFLVELTLGHFEGSSGQPHCSFWNETVSGWDENGCNKSTASDDKTTVCVCNHLTNFAILMSPWVENQQTKALDIISIAGCSVSLVALVLTVVLHFSLWRYVRSDRVVILVNLSIALVISYAIFLGGVDRTENKDACTAVAVLLQYIYLVVFFLMLAEGVEIAVSVLYVFATKSRLKWLLPAAWLVPVVIVGISLGATQLKGYGNDQFCWLSIKGGLIWAFVAPALLVILINFVILALVIRAMLRSSSLAEKSRSERVRASVRCLCILLPVMGCTWVIGIFYVNESMAWVQYVFAVCNSLQGLVIFICHCAINKQIRMAIKRRKKKYFDSLMTSKSSTKQITIPRVSSTSSAQYNNDGFSRGFDSRGNERRSFTSSQNSYEMASSKEGLYELKRRL